MGYHVSFQGPAGDERRPHTEGGGRARHRTGHSLESKKPCHMPFPPPLVGEILGHVLRATCSLPLIPSAYAGVSAEKSWESPERSGGGWGCGGPGLWYRERLRGRGFIQCHLRSQGLVLVILLPFLGSWQRANQGHGEGGRRGPGGQVLFPNHLVPPSGPVPQLFPSPLYGDDPRLRDSLGSLGHAQVSNELGS